MLYNGQPVDPFGGSGNYPDPWQQAVSVTSNFLWARGQFANPSTPNQLPASPFTLTLDDSNAGFARGDQFGDCAFSDCRNWRYATGVGQNNEMWWTTVNTGNGEYAIWQPNFPTSRFYEVQVFIPRLNATTWEAPYLIYYTDGALQSALVDQQGTSDRWLSLGVYYFSTGSSPYNQVRVTNATQDRENTRLSVHPHRDKAIAPGSHSLHLLANVKPSNATRIRGLVHSHNGQTCKSGSANPICELLALAEV